MCTIHECGAFKSSQMPQTSPQTLLKEVLLCLSSVAAGGPKLAESLARLQALVPLTQLVRGNNTPPPLKAAALNTLAQVWDMERSPDSCVRRGHVSCNADNDCMLLPCCLQVK
jgi:hypothetical protein